MEVTGIPTDRRISKPYCHLRRSMYYDEIIILCCVSLKTHQTRMDVIGNNIANVNTEAFKASSVRFSELMYQTMSTASGGMRQPVRVVSMPSRLVLV